MSRPPAAVIKLDPTDPDARRIWASALSLMRELKGDWTLIGGLMVQLLTVRYGQGGVRPTNDVDILADTRTRPSASVRIAQKLAAMGFEAAEPGGRNRKTAYRFTRGDETVDVLGSDGLGTPARTLDNQETVEVSGGTQALRRSETIIVELDGEQTTLRCPSLFGAIVLKSRAIMSPLRDQDREDLVRLLLCADDFQSMRTEMTNGDRRSLVAAGAKLNFEDRGLADLFSPEQIAQARAAYRLLTQS